MAHFDRDEDTICALTTGAGQSGIAVIRVSGPESFSIVKQLCPFLPEEPTSHRVYHGMLKENEKSIDEVLVSYFAKGRSYTGDETCEISCHGSPVVASQVLSNLVRLGCRPADRGEFTYRSFMNGRIDLIQAESVLSLIESSSKKAARLAVDQLQGQLSELFRDIEESIIWILSRIEAGIDFSTEGLEIVDDAEIQNRLNALIQATEKLLASYQTGRLLTDGIKIVLAGRPNAGKSSLLNALIRTDRAIVSHVAGTTRDTVEATYKIGGVCATLVDTAGLRDAGDEIEKLGVERSVRAIDSSDLVLYLIDASQTDPRSVILDLSKFDGKQVVTVLNKIDLISDGQKMKLRADVPTDFVEISAKNRTGLEVLEHQISSSFRLDASDETTVLIHARHEKNLRAASEALQRARKAFADGMSHEFACLDLRDALLRIGNILGKGLDEDVISKIFEDFCIGK